MPHSTPATPAAPKPPTSLSAIEMIPNYLQPYVVRQDPSLYTPMDHAGWRFILKISKDFFAQHAHQKYLDGLSETGISTERIPLIEEMDQCLRNFGWRAVAVSGFIPPAVFMEFQSLGILPIACDMRQVEHLAYTPAPDIVHEAAGHAPLIASPDYAEYLKAYGELSRKAIYSSQDMAVYEAIRRLSIVKEDPGSTIGDIADAQTSLDSALAAVDYVSEATLLSRMGWWTFEYGLVGSVEQPKIFGAGLLSSVGESYHCVGPEVKKIPFSVACVDMTYDITRPQPQLFVARDFEQLKDALEELSRTMAFRRGGMEGLAKALQAKTVTTTLLDSGLQISGTLTHVRRDGREGARGNPVYLQYSGPTQLSYGETEITGHGAQTHAEGFGTPVGLIKGLGKPAYELTETNLERITQAGRLEFESGVVVQGKLNGKIERDGKIVILSFGGCTVTHGGDTLFRPEWGDYDMACGSGITSVFGGAADRRQYLAATGGFRQEAGRPKTNLTPENRALNELYAAVRQVRESGAAKASDTRTTSAHPAYPAYKELERVHRELERAYPNDWLLRYELLELKTGEPWEADVRAALDRVARQSALSPETAAKSEMIARGMAAL